MNESVVIGPDAAAAMQDLGIDQSSLDDGSIEAPQDEAQEPEVGKENSDQDEQAEAAESAETNEANQEAAQESAPVVEEPKLTLKEFQEIEKRSQDLNLREQAFKEEVQRTETELQTKYGAKAQAHDDLDNFLTNVAAENPAFFEEIKSAFQAYQAQYKNPVIEGLTQKQAALEKELNQFKAKASDEVTRTKLDSELNEARKTLGKQAEDAGIKPDWTKIEDFWADNPKSNIEAAFFAIHGPAMMKAAVSKAKLDTVGKQVAARPTVKTAGVMNRSSAPAEKDFSKMSIGEMLKYEARKITGRT